jgi:hypothetical protein
MVVVASAAAADPPDKANAHKARANKYCRKAADVSSTEGQDDVTTPAHFCQSRTRPQTKNPPFGGSRKGTVLKGPDPAPGATFSATAEEEMRAPQR